MELSKHYSEIRKTSNTRDVVGDAAQALLYAINVSTESATKTTVFFLLRLKD